MSRPGDLVYLPSEAPIIRSASQKWEVLYPEKPGYYVVCEKRKGPGPPWLDPAAVTIIYEGSTAWVLNKYITKEN
mgnify:CR=1 FL=1|jgi:hypothetical protein